MGVFFISGDRGLQLGEPQHSQSPKSTLHHRHLPRSGQLHLALAMLNLSPRCLASLVRDTSSSNVAHISLSTTKYCDKRACTLPILASLVITKHVKTDCR